MKKIAFFYRENESLPAFAANVLVSLFNLWGLENAHIKHIMAGNNQKAGEFAFDEFMESKCNILVIDDWISLPEGVPHIIFNKTDTFSSFLGKMVTLEETYSAA
jgi:hypothetical protein